MSLPPSSRSHYVDRMPVVACVQCSLHSSPTWPHVRFSRNYALILLIPSHADHIIGHEAFSQNSLIWSLHKHHFCSSRWEITGCLSVYTLLHSYGTQHSVWTSNYSPSMGTGTHSWPQAGRTSKDRSNAFIIVYYTCTILSVSGHMCNSSWQHATPVFVHAHTCTANYALRFHSRHSWCVLYVLLYSTHQNKLFPTLKVGHVDHLPFNFAFILLCIYTDVCIVLSSSSL